MFNNTFGLRIDSHPTPNGRGKRSPEIFTFPTGDRLSLRLSLHFSCSKLQNWLFKLRFDRNGYVELVRRVV